MALYVTPYGNEIRSYIPGGLPIPPDDGVPLTFVMMVTKYQGRYLMLYNPERQQWEIPGGGINPGETPEQTAHRELMEESSQVAASLIFRGIFKLWLNVEDREEYGALYTVEVSELRDHVPNEESEKIAFYASVDDIPDVFSALSRWMVATCAAL
jgi:8-oxo-dGTP diphosphatase